MGSLGQFFAQVFAPMGFVLHDAVYLPIFNALVALDEAVHALLPALPAYASAIILLGLLVQVALMPITRGQMRASTAMQALTPQLQELQRRCRGQPQELMAAQQALYRAHGISVYGGCLSLLLQLPFLLGVYYSSRAVLLAQPGETAAQHLARVNSDLYPFLPRLDALPDLTFLWMNLAAPDHWLILPALAALFSFLQVCLAKRRGKRAAQATLGSNRAQSSLLEVIMPALWFFICLNIASAAGLYIALWMAANLVQQFFLASVPPPVQAAHDAEFVL